MDQSRLKRLLFSYFNNSISEADRVELLDYLSSVSIDEADKSIPNEFIDVTKGPAFTEKQSDAVFQKIITDSRFHKEHVNVDEPKNRPLTYYRNTWYWAAAAMVVFLSAAWLFVAHMYSRPAKEVRYTRQRTSIIVPGGKKATLTTADGKHITLDEAANGVLVKNKAYQVVKLHNGQIAYHHQETTGQQAAIGFNTLTTPKGGEYAVVLPDGTKVWLNAASAITYPTAFNGKDRRVTLSGEAYFEVAHNARQPFYVSMNDVQVRVLGTHFNVSAYSDDSDITTTLLEGSVQVTKNQSISKLQPGQQARVNHKTDHIVVSQANIEEAMAWKNGYFIFDDDDISGIMKKVCRWYDVDVQYQDSFKDQKFGGTFHRSKGITELLHHLEQIGGVHFATTGRRITVMR